MAKRRTHAKDGQFIADNPETLNVNEAWEETTPTASEDTSELSSDEHQEEREVELAKEVTLAPVEEKNVEAIVENPLAPVELELKIGSQENKLPDKLSKEKIEAAVKEKLSRKTDSTESNPFVPQTQLENEVKEVAKAKGFPLSRGTEIGARLLARSKRRLN